MYNIYKNCFLVLLTVLIIHHYVNFVIYAPLFSDDMIYNSPCCDDLKIYNSTTALRYHNVNDHVISGPHFYGAVATIKYEKGSSPPRSKIHPLTSLIMNQKKPKKIVVVNIGQAAAKNNGIGSQLNIIVLIDLYFQKEDHQMVIIQSNSRTYRYNSSIGFFGGFTRTIESDDDGEEFYSPFLVLNERNEYTKVIMESYDLGYDNNDDLPSQQQIEYFDLDKMIGHRKVIRFIYKQRYQHCQLGWPGKCPTSFMKQKAIKLISYLNYTSNVQNQINNILQRNLPSDLKNINETIAFHVRRTDKVQADSNLHYHTDEYVKLFMQEQGGHDLSTKTQTTELRYCLLATDDIETVLPELIDSIRKYNMTCEVYPIISIPHGTERKKRSETIQLLTEIEVLSSAKYFAGSLSSSIGDVVAHLRLAKKMKQNTSETGGEETTTVDDDYSIFNCNSFFVDLVI